MQQKFHDPFGVLDNGVALLNPYQKLIQALTDNLICEVQDGSSSWSTGVWGQSEISPSRNDSTKPTPPPYNPLQAITRSSAIHGFTRLMPMDGNLRDVAADCPRLGDVGAKIGCNHIQRPLSVRRLGGTNNAVAHQTPLKAPAH